MTGLTMPQDGRILIPQDVRDRYGFTDETPVRIIETRSGILLVPVSNHAMSDELAKELADWQELSTSTWGAFPYEENPQ